MLDPILSTYLLRSQLTSANQPSPKPSTGFGIMLALLAFTQLLRPRKSREKDRASFLATMERANAEAAQRATAHKRERLAKGLSERAGTGPAEPRVFLLGLPRIDLPYEDKPRPLGAMISAIESAKLRRDQLTLSTLPLGHSRLGGLPDLPPNVPWPTHNGKKLPFLAQLDLSTFPPSAHKLLPNDGHLFAFSLSSNDHAHWPPPTSVFLHRGPASSLVRQPRPDDSDLWPDWTNTRIYELLPATTTRPKKPSADSDQTLGWLYGEMEPYFGTPGEIADDRFGDGNDWINLLAFHSAGSMQWSDSGHLYLLIRKSALANLDFSNVLAAVCSS